MKKLTRTIAAVSALAMSVGALSACGGSNVNADKGHVYFLSMKVEQQDQFKELAEKFTKKTGIQVDIATASSDTYEQSLKSELAKSEAPTLFDVGNNDFLNWTNYYADMSGTNIYKDQENPDYALKDGDTVGAVPYVMERYGIIYNKKLLQKYFDSSWASIKSVDSINNFKTLKTVADEIQAHKDEMGVKGAFTSAGFDTSSIKRFGDQLAHISHVERILMQRGQADLCGKWYVVESDDRELLRDGVPVLAQLIDDRQCQLVTFAIQCGGGGVHGQQ